MKPVIAFFNNKGGVGKTSLVYHIAWMLADRGLRVVAVDLDPQGNLSAAFLEEETLEALWPENADPSTIYGAIKPLKTGVGDVREPHLEEVTPKSKMTPSLFGDIKEPHREEITPSLNLIPGDMGLSAFEDDLSQVWPKCLDRDERAFRVISAFWRAMQQGADKAHADVILIDLGPNLGAINRAALIASDYVVIPLAPDLFSLQGLQNLGPTLRDWRAGWKERLNKNPVQDLELPSGNMQPIGYIVMQHSVRRDRPVKSYEKWIARIPKVYRESVLNEKVKAPPSVQDDKYCFALLKHYRSLMPMAQEARKPMFHLKPADGAIGAHASAVKEAYNDFLRLTQTIGNKAGLPVP